MTLRRNYAAQSAPLSSSASFKTGVKNTMIVCRLSSSMCSKQFSHSVAKATSCVPERKSASFVSKMSLHVTAERSEMSLGIENWVISREWPATKSNVLASQLHKYHIFQLVCHIAVHCKCLCLSGNTYLNILWNQDRLLKIQQAAISKLQVLHCFAVVIGTSG